MPTTDPFWEATYRNNSASTFGEPSDEIVRLASTMPRGARVLDLGCGDGRNALFLAAAGLDVHAIDISHNGIAKLNALAAERGVTVHTEIADIASYTIEGDFDLIIAHGVLHLLPRESWLRAIQEMKQRTREGGYNVIVVFTDALPAPDDLAPHMHGLFREGELKKLYDDWIVEQFDSYVLDDEHDGPLNANGDRTVIRHRHPINKLVAKRP